ncbi:MAG: bifunctional D-altronate/D-mannonate dehydratase [Planctomycetales bacterium]|nr:bifunctional D-altronate/D-mannonate dehydratase [Planctomycetales bacterium]
MDRRQWLSGAVAATGGLSIATSGPRSLLVPLLAATAQDPLQITNVKTILTAPAGIRLVVVKVETNEPGLYGLGCATFTQRARAVETAVDRYLKPFLIGKDPTRIEDIWQSSFVSSYWRNGPVLNNAISGVDMALWDILGKRTGRPLYELFGGKCREAVDTYRHASGSSLESVAENVRRYLDEGFRHVRVQMAVEGMSTYGARSTTADQSDFPANRRTNVWEPRPYVQAVPKLFDYLRHEVGDAVELLHDVHERIPPILAIQLAKDLEPYRLFFLEDPFSPEDVGYFQHLRAQSSTPIAMGELFNNPNEFTGLIKDRLIDFIRVHISQIGGLTPARKLAALCEYFAVRTAWHGPGDVSPVGHAANVHLDIATPNFGIQEARSFSSAEQDVFPGCPELRDGYYWLSDQPGLGIDLDERLAARFPIEDDPPFDMNWGNLRRADGTSTKP